MKRQIIDLSISIETGLPSDPEIMIPKVDYLTHEQGADQMAFFFPGLKKNISLKVLDGRWSLLS